jgi:hypothetical protein
MKHRHLACAALLLAACGPTPIEVPAPVFTPPPVAAEPEIVAQRQPLQVAGPAERRGAHRLHTIDATSPRTSIGRYPAGARVRISVVDAHWSARPGGPFVGASGFADQRCASPGCLAGDGAAPLMGLTLLTIPTAEPACGAQDRLYIPDGVEFLVPEDTELWLAPNDRPDLLAGNVGAIQVEVHVTQGRGGKTISRAKVEVDARRPRTAIGRFRAGEYVRVSILGGRWGHGPGAVTVDARGVARALCQAASGQRCLGDAKTPLMGLVMLVGTCPASGVERRYVPTGAEVRLTREAELFLGPNEREDACQDNAGAVVVDVESEP